MFQVSAVVVGERFLAPPPPASPPPLLLLLLLYWFSYTTEVFEAGYLCCIAVLMAS